MKPIPTVKEHFTQYWTGWANSPVEIRGAETEDELIERSMIEFAKLHVEAALKAALEDFPCGSSTDTVSHEDAADAILNAYPLNNIK